MKNNNKKSTSAAIINFVPNELLTNLFLLSLFFAGIYRNIAIPKITSLHWITIISIGGLTAHFCITSALTLAPASVVAPLEFLRLPLIAVVGYFAYDEALSIFVLIDSLE